MEKHKEFIGENCQNGILNAKTSGTPRPNVPALRFPEFTEEWKRICVSDLLDFYSTNSLSWEQLEYDSNEPYNLHYGLIHVGLPTLVDLTKDELPSIKDGNVPKKYELCKEGDVAFADASEDTNEVAKVVEFYNLEDKKVVCGLHTIHGRDNNEQAAKGFLGYCFSSNVFHHQIRRIAQGTKIYSISTKNFSEVFVGLPNKNEQQKIATLLRLMDERITIQNRIIEKLETLIKGVVVSHYRKCLDKQAVKISELGESFTVGVLAKEDLAEDGTPCILYGELFTTYNCVANVIERKTKKINNQVYSKGDELLFPTSTTVDAISLISPIALTVANVVLGGDMFGIHIKKEYNAIYLSYILNYVYRHRMAKYAHGSTIIHLHYADIKNFKLLLPPIDKQEKIVNALNRMQEKIDSERQFRKLLAKLHSFLLSKLFI